MFDMYEKEEIKGFRRLYVGQKIKIKYVEDEPAYTGKSGICNYVDDIGQLHGTWGGIALLPYIDEFEIVED